MKKFCKLVLAGFLGAMVFTAGGCIYTYDNPSVQGSPSLYGFKVCYTDNNYVLDNTFNVFATHILSELYANFGVVNGTVYQSGVTPSPVSTRSENYDRIRVQQTASGVASESWNWSFSQTLSGAESQTDANQVVNYYTDSTRQTTYFNHFVNLYAPALEAVAIQIAMGQTPQTFIVEINGETTNVFANSQKTTLVNEAFVEILKTQFASTGKYVGFTPENTQTFKNYLLTEVIGTHIIGTQFDKIYLADKTVTYSQIIDQILALPASTDKDFYSPYPASNVLDVTNTDFYPNSTTDSLSHITARQYQSITFMPKKNTEILSIIMSFEAEYDLTLAVSATLTTAQTQTVLFSGSVTIPAGKFRAENMWLIPLNQVASLSTFENNFMPANTPLAISNANQTAKYYDYTASGAVLNATLQTQNYLTISFVPQSSASEYKPFKWAINSMMIGD